MWPVYDRLDHKNVFRKIDGEKNKTHLGPTTQKFKLFRVSYE